MIDIESNEYIHKVYAGVLGKMIGVYLGRPIEGMLYRDILRDFGPINYYVHGRRNMNLIVSDDDLSGTFTFVRALEDFPAAGHDLTAKQIGQTWLNYVIDNKTIFWWGGVGLSTEHTAYLRLKNGIDAPQSGSIALNSKVVAEQIGAQIFIDGWAMVAPGDSTLAADLACKAASVSHDGEAVYAAQLLAVMEAMAFVETDLNRLLDEGLRFIPADSLIHRMVSDLRDFHANEPNDWEAAFTGVLEKTYGYDKYGGNCHVIPNHGIIILALLYGQDSFQRTQMIANTCGWDTDCNAGNVGCLMGIRGGLAGIEAGPDWRGPVADRLIIPTADGGDCITDAVQQTYRLVNIARSLRGLVPISPKDGARYHFSLPGSTQGFVAASGIDLSAATRVSNDDGRLRIDFHKLAEKQTARVALSAFPSIGTAVGSYGIYATPLLVTGQTLKARVSTDASSPPIHANLVLAYAGANDQPEYLRGPAVNLSPDQSRELTWIVPPTNGQPIIEIGLELTGVDGVSGTVWLDWLTWDGEPELTLGVSKVPGKAARQQWIDAVDTFQLTYDGKNPNNAFLVINNVGRGMAIHGNRQWKDYTLTSTLTPHLALACGIAVRVQGLRRYYALLLKHPNRVALVKVLNDEQTLAEAPFEWKWNDEPHELSLRVQGTRLVAQVDGKTVFDLQDQSEPLANGGVALVIEEGRMASGEVRISGAS